MATSLAALLAGSLIAPLAHGSAELEAVGDHFEDAGGGVIVLRGVNVAGNSKVPPFRPAADPAIFDPLETWGMNVVRLVFTWEAYEPTKGSYDETYLDYYAAAASAAWQHGLYVIVDFHQDAFSRYNIGGCGDGFPAWTLPPSITPAVPNNGPSCSGWGSQTLGNADLKTAWTSFFADEVGARTGYLMMVDRVAKRLAANPGVIGYDLINEPGGNEVNEIAPLYTEAAAVIRGDDASAIIFESPRTITSAGLQTNLPAPTFGNVVYSPHYYDSSLYLSGSWSGMPPTMAFKTMTDKATEWDVPLFLGEFGVASGTGNGLGYLDSVYDLLNQTFTSATAWCYTPGWTEAGKDGWNTEDYSIVDDAGMLRDNFRVRPFARRVAGTPTSIVVTLGATPDANQVELAWQHVPATGATELFVPADFFGGSAPSVATTTAGLTCAVDGTLVHCSSAEGGDARIVVTATIGPTPPPLPGSGGSNNCGLTGAEALPFYALVRRLARRRKRR